MTTSFTTLLNVDAEASATTLTDFIARLIDGDSAAFTAECQTLLAGAQTEALISKYLEHSNAFFAQENEKDAESCIQAIVSVLITLNEQVDSEQVVKNIVTSIVSDTVSKPKRRLQALMSLFNLIVEPLSRYGIFIAMLKYAVAVNQPGTISRYHVYVVEWADAWSISVEQRRELFKLTAELLTLDQKPSLALTYFNLLLKSFGDEDLPAEIETLAVGTVVKAINTPAAALSDRNGVLENMPKQTKKGPLASLIELLRIVCSGSLELFNSFCADAANDALLVSHGISKDNLRHTMGLLTICSLATEQTLMTYQDIAVALSVPLEEVELWVIEVISSGLMDGSIDQIAGTVTVSRCSYRSFGPAQWAKLQLKLRGIRTNLTNVLDLVRKQSGAV